MFTLSDRSMWQLHGVHKDLIAVVTRAIEITVVDFVVIEGLRTPEKQKALMDSGATRTLNSRHITGHAVDLAAWAAGEVRWDWPLYKDIAVAMKAAASELSVPIQWGGDWKTFKDGPHFELTRKAYP
jgi:peptidoglycan L-alanyl-D-glutamate endopeptidase CwlK